MKITSENYLVGMVSLGFGALFACGALGCSGGGTTGTGGTSSSTTGTAAGTTTGVTTGTATGTTGATTSASTASGTTAAQACMDLVHVECTQRDKCSLNSFLNDRNWGSEANCESRNLAPCVSALMAMGTAQTPAHIEACVAAYPTYTCTDFFDINPPAACIAPAGSVAMGGACGANAQCTTGFCAVADHEVCGTCKTLPVAGATCQVQGDCGRDLACAIPVGMTSGTCAAFVAGGGMCLTGSAPCQNGFACVGEVIATSTKGTCTAEGSTVGAACDSSRKTAASCNAAMGLFCKPNAGGSTIGTCAAITLAMPGQACGAMGTPVTGFAECGSSGLCVNKLCVAPAADNAACDSVNGPPCLLPAQCVPTGTGTAGTCKLPDATQCH